MTQNSYNNQSILKVLTHNCNKIMNSTKLMINSCLTQLLCLSLGSVVIYVFLVYSSMLGIGCWLTNHACDTKYTVQLEIFVRRKFSPISSLITLIGKNFIYEFFFSCVKDCIVDMETFTVLVKILPLKN